MKTNYISNQIEMSNRITETTNHLIQSIQNGNTDEVRETLQLFIIQFELYREQIGEYNER
jgi:hypothetical protein